MIHHLAMRWKALNEKLMKFQAMRIQGNKDAMKGLLDEIKKIADAMFNPVGDNAGGLAGVVAGMVKQAEEIKENLTAAFGAPTLAIKGSQAAARGELGLLNTNQMQLKVMQQQLAVERQQLAEMKKNQLPGNANFNLGGM